MPRYPLLQWSDFFEKIRTGSIPVLRKRWLLFPFIHVNVPKRVRRGKTSQCKPTDRCTRKPVGLPGMDGAPGRSCCGSAAGVESGGNGQAPLHYPRYGEDKHLSRE